MFTEHGELISANTYNSHRPDGHSNWKDCNCSSSETSQSRSVGHGLGSFSKQIRHCILHFAYDLDGFFFAAFLLAFLTAFGCSIFASL